MEKYNKLKGIIRNTTIALAAIDLLFGFISPTYPSSIAPILYTGYISYMSVVEYSRYKEGIVKFSKVVAILGVVAISLGIASITQNVIKIISSI